MPYATDRATPQCGNVDIENQDTVRTSGLRKYFCVHTSDPLLDVVEWISYSTEVGPIVIAAWLLILFILLLLPLLLWLPFLLQYLTFQLVVIFVFLLLTGGVTGWCYLRFMWVKPSQHLRLGIQQLSALKFLPWMLNAFIHTLSLAYFCFCYITRRTNTLPWPLEMITDLTYWHWAIVWTLILAPQFVVFAAVIRIRRLNNERKKSLMTEPFQNIGSPTTTSPQPDLPSHSQYVGLYPPSADISETSHLSEEDLEDLPPSYSTLELFSGALEPSHSALPPSYSTLEVLQNGPKYFKT